MIKITSLHLSANRRLILFLAAAIFPLLLSSGFALAKKESLSMPIIPMKLKNPPLPFFELGLQLEDASFPQVRNMANYFDVRKSVSNKKSQLKTQKGKARFTTKLSILKHQIALRNFLVKMNHNIFGKDERIKNIRDEINSLKKEIQRNALTLLKSEKKRSMRAWYLYQSYSIPPYSLSTLKKLKKIKSISPTSKKINNRVDFILFSKLSAAKNIIGKRSNLKKLESKYYESTRGLPAYAQLSTAITLARSYGGQTENEIIRKPDSNRFSYFLKLAGRKSKGMSNSQKDLILDSLLSIWINAKGSRVNYLKIPFDLSIFSKSNLSDAVKERKALAYRKAGKKEKSKREYYRLSKSKKSIPYKLKLLSRIIAWEKEDYKKTRKISSLEKEIKLQISLISDNSDEAHSKYLLSLLESYKGLVNSEIKRAKGTKASKALVTSTIHLIDRYLKSTSPSDSDYAEMQKQAGLLYVKLRQHKKSVTRFLMSADKHPTPKYKSDSLKLAISSQTKVANWSNTPPWRTTPKYNKGELAVLAKIYKRKNRQLDTFTWQDIAQEGLINITLNNKIYSADLWSEHLQKSPTGQDSSKAAYQTYNIYKVSKNWNKLEKISRFLTSRSVNPNFYGKSQNSKDVLALSLFEGGKKDFSEGKFETSVKKFREYVSRFNKPNKDEARFFLSKALWKNRDYREAIEESVYLVKNFSKSKRWEESCLLGFEWSRSIALESTTLFFVEEYVKKYTNNKSYVMRQLGARLYLGLEKYLDAIRHISKLIDMKQSSRAKKVELTENLLTILDQHGSPAAAFKIAEKLLSMSPSNDAKAKAYFVRAKKYQKDRNRAELVNLEKLLRKLPKSSPTIVTAHASTMYMIASSSIDQSLFEQVHNTSLVNPQKYIEETTAKLINLYVLYKSVCSIGISSVCPDAMNNFEQMALKVLANIDEVEINDTLDDATVSSFDSVKSSHVEKIKSLINSSYTIAFNATSKGTALPETTQETLWRKGLDWNFEPISSTPGSGYIRWRMTANEN